MLFWKAPSGKGWQNEACKYVVYRFAKGESQNLNDASHIVAITPNTYYNLPQRSRESVYVVTALDRLSNESKGKKVKY